MRRLSISVFLSAVLVLALNAQDGEEEFKPTLEWKGFTHLWASYTMDESDAYYGFTVRYLRFKAYGNLLPKVKWEAQFAFDRGVPALLDVNLSWEPIEYINIKAGQFPVPGVKSSVFSCNLWSTTKMILNDRPMTTQNWASYAGLTGYRSMGAMLYGGFLDKKINYYAMLSSARSGPLYYFNPSVKNPTYSHDENGLALFTRLEIKPIEEMAFGVNYHTGTGITDDTVSVQRNSYSVYFITRISGMSVMAEYINGGNKTEYNETLDSEVNYSGFYLEGAYRFKEKYEPVARFEVYNPVDEGVDSRGFEKYNDITLGFNFYPAKNIALMLNYVVRLETPGDGFEEISNDLLYLQLRYQFSSN